MLFIIYGCAGMEAQKVDEEYVELKRTIAGLKASIDEMELRVNELNDRVLLLHEKVETNKEEIGRFKSTLQIVTPPDGLKVIKLTEEETDKGEYNKEDREEREASVERPDAIYSHAQDLFLSGRYDRARKVFYRLVEEFPESNLADNALYWIGESYYSEQNYREALSVFQEVVRRYPYENKAPDALLKVGFSYMEMQDTKRAKEVLKELIERYPDTEASFKAEKTLKKVFGPKGEDRR